MRRELVRQSKYLSLILRHDPSVVGVTLDGAGWVDVDDLLEAIGPRRPGFTREVLDEIVATNAKKRFAFSDDGRRIRASQGHSIGVQLGLEAVAPPGELFHGTADRNVESIRENGLIRGRRDYVHLSADAGTATKVGTRHGTPVVLTIRARAMADAGHDFYLAENGVWLTGAVPVEFIRIP